MELTAIVPTHNRRETLRKSVEAYLNQTDRVPDFEILVVDDGSSDGTSETVAELIAAHPGRIRYLRQPNRGCAAARNRGIREAAGEIILFTDDDIIPAPQLVAEHWRWHQRHPEPGVAVLGAMPWSPEVEATPFMKWAASEGPLFDLRGVANPSGLDWRYFFPCNISLKTRFLRENGLFDEDFRTYGWEDTELGYRLSKHGLRVLYNPRAVGYHYRRLTFAEACRRAQQVVAARSLFEQKEAGKFVAQWQRNRDSQPARRLGRWLARWAVPLMAPLKPVLDSRIPLPSPVYRAFHWYYGTRAAETREEAEVRANPKTLSF